MQRVFEALQLRKLGRLRRAVGHVRDLVRCNSRRIRAKRQINQVIHSANELQWGFIVRLKVQQRPLFIAQLRTWNLQPTLRSLDALFDLSHGCQILIQLFAILISQSVSQRMRIIEDSIQHTGSGS